MEALLIIPLVLFLSQQGRKAYFTEYGISAVKNTKVSLSGISFDVVISINNTSDFPVKLKRFLADILVNGGKIGRIDLPTAIEIPVGKSEFSVNVNVSSSATAFAIAKIAFDKAKTGESSLSVGVNGTMFTNGGNFDLKDEFKVW